MTNTPMLEHAAPRHGDDYTPVFSDKIRTWVYILGLVASVVGLGFMCFGHPEIGGFISTAAGAIAAGFGVAYNPVRLSDK